METNSYLMLLPNEVLFQLIGCIHNTEALHNFSQTSKQSLAVAKACIEQIKCDIQHHLETNQKIVQTSILKQIPYPANQLTILFLKIFNLNPKILPAFYQDHRIDFDECLKQACLNNDSKIVNRLLENVSFDPHTLHDCFIQSLEKFQPKIFRLLAKKLVEGMDDQIDSLDLQILDDKDKNALYYYKSASDLDGFILSYLKQTQFSVPETYLANILVIASELKLVLAVKFLLNKVSSVLTKQQKTTILNTISRQTWCSWEQEDLFKTFTQEEVIPTLCLSAVRDNNFLFVSNLLKEHFQFLSKYSGYLLVWICNRICEFNSLSEQNTLIEIFTQLINSKPQLPNFVKWTAPKDLRALIEKVQDENNNLLNCFSTLLFFNIEQRLHTNQLPILSLKPNFLSNEALIEILSKSDEPSFVITLLQKEMFIQEPLTELIKHAILNQNQLLLRAITPYINLKLLLKGYINANQTDYILDFLQLMNPAFFDADLFIWAFKRGEKAIAQKLLENSQRGYLKDLSKICLGALSQAIYCKQYDIINLLLLDPRFDPSVNGYELVRIVVKHRLFDTLEIVLRLLKEQGHTLTAEQIIELDFWHHSKEKVLRNVQTVIDKL